MSGYVRGAGSAGQPSCPHEPARCGRVVLTAAARLAMSALLRVRVWGQRAGQVWGTKTHSCKHLRAGHTRVVFLCMGCLHSV